MAVDHHEATAAGAFGCAAVLRRQHPKLLAQHLEEIHPRLVGGLHRPSVHIHLDPGHSAQCIITQFSAVKRKWRSPVSSTPSACIASKPACPPSPNRTALPSKTLP